jgi:hypothetical protein
VRDVGGEVRGVPAAEPDFAALRADGERPGQADDEFLGAGRVGRAGVPDSCLEADLEELEAAIAAVDVDQPTADPGRE